VASVDGTLVLVVVVATVDEGPDEGAANCATESPPHPATNASADTTKIRTRRNLIACFDDAAATILPSSSVLAAQRRTDLDVVLPVRINREGRG